MEVERANVGWSFWLQWVLASSVGFVMAVIVSLLVVMAIEPMVVPRLGAFVGATIVGAVVGIMQWLVLRRRLHRAGWWVLASAVGWAVGWAGSQELILIERVFMALSKYDEALGGRSVVTLSVIGVLVGGQSGSCNGLS